MSQRKVHPVAAIIKSALNGNSNNNGTNNNNNNRHVHFDEEEPEIVVIPNTSQEEDDATPKRPPPYPGLRQQPHPVAELIKSAFNNNTAAKSDSEDDSQEDSDPTDDSDTDHHVVLRSSQNYSHLRTAHRNSLDIAMMHHQILPESTTDRAREKSAETPPQMHRQLLPESISSTKARQDSVETPPPSPGTPTNSPTRKVTFTIPTSLPRSPSESSLGSADVPPSPVSPPPKIDVFVPPKDLSPPHDSRARDLRDWRVCALDFTAREFLEPADLVEPCVWRERVVPSLVVRLWSRASKRYLRVLDSGDVYGRSSFGPTGHFRLIQVGRVSPNQPVVILQCTADPDRHVAVQHNRLVGNGNGGLQSEFIVVQNDAGFCTFEARCAPGQYLGIRPNGNVMKPADVPGRKSVEAQLVVQSEAAKI